MIAIYISGSEVQPYRCAVRRKERTGEFGWNKDGRGGVRETKGHQCSTRQEQAQRLIGSVWRREFRVKSASREKGKACERGLYESELGTALVLGQRLGVSERNLTLAYEPAANGFHLSLYGIGDEDGDIAGTELAEDLRGRENQD